MKYSDSTKISIRSSTPKDVIHLQHKIHSTTLSLILKLLLSCYRKRNKEKHFSLTVLNSLQRTIRHKQMTYFTLRSYSEPFPSRTCTISLNVLKSTTSCVTHCALQTIHLRVTCHIVFFWIISHISALSGDVLELSIRSIFTGVERSTPMETERLESSKTSALKDQTSGDYP